MVGGRYKAAMLLLVLGTRLWSADHKQPTVTDRRFETHIRPVLAAKCQNCHGSKKQEANLRLDSLAAMLEGGESGPAIVQGKPWESMLMEAIKYESLEMPPTWQLSSAEIRPFADWIAKGAR